MTPMKNCLLRVAMLTLSLTAAFANERLLWYEQPASENKPMDEALAIGNGRMGGLVFGKPTREHIIINEDSLWTGDKNPSGDYDHMGAYQVLGSLFIDLPGHDKTEAYRRELDIGDAMARVSYRANGVKYQREFFCSHPAGVLLANFTADKRGRYSGKIELADSHRARTLISG